MGGRIPAAGSQENRLLHVSGSYRLVGGETIQITGGDRVLPSWQQKKLPWEWGGGGVVWGGVGGGRGPGEQFHHKYNAHLSKKADLC